MSVDEVAGRSGLGWRFVRGAGLAVLFAVPVHAQEPADPEPQEPEPVVAVPMAATPKEAALGPVERDAVAKLQSSKPAVRREGLERLGEMKSIGASADVAKLGASDPDPSVRRTAAVSLGRIRDEARIPDLAAMLKDADPTVRLGAVEGLVNLYVDREEGFFTRVRSTLVAVVPFWNENRPRSVEPYDEIDPRVTAALAESLRRDADQKVRVASVRALGALQARSEIDALADAMTADEKLRHEVLDAFVMIGATEAAPYAIPFFEHPDEKLAAHAMIAAGRLRSSQAVVPLLNVYNQKEEGASIAETFKRKVTFAPERRKVTVQALALIGDPRAEKVFYDNMYDKDPEVRRAAYEGIGREGDPRFFDVVTRNRLMERDESVRLAQQFALYKMGHPDMFGNFVNALTSRSLRDQGYEYVLAADSPEHLLPYARMRDKEIQRMILEALGEIGDEETIKELAAFQRGFAPEIATVAARSARRIEWRMAQQAPSVEGAARPRRVGEP